MSRVFTFAVFALAATAGPAICQVHMCTGPDGRKAFSDVSCGPGSKVIEVKPPVAGAVVGPSTNMQSEYYEIRGNTYEDLRRQIADKGPDGFWGWANTRMTYELATRKTPAGCAVDTVRATADSKVRLPRWVNRAEASAAVQDRWDTSIRSLDYHERGHVRISLDGARQLERSILDTPEKASCDLVHAEAKKRSDAVRALVQNQQVTYDLETDHGRSQWSPYR